MAYLAVITLLTLSALCLHIATCLPQNQLSSSGNVSPFITYLCDDDLLKTTSNKMDLLNLKFENHNLRLQSDFNAMREQLLREIKTNLELMELKAKNVCTEQCKSNEVIPPPPPLLKAASTCAEAMLKPNGEYAPSGVYELYLPEYLPQPFSVYCLQDTDGGGPWTIIQRRQNNDTDFYRGWYEYVNGFGDLESNFWLGLDKIYALTQSHMYNLWFQLENFQNEKRYAKYESFAIDGASGKYALSVLGEFSGTAGDSFTPHRGEKFTTKDSDNDQWGENCAKQYTGAWWYQKCHASNLNGLYYGGEFPKDQYAKGVVWHSWLGHYYSLKYVHMAMRPRKLL
ncbi:unnamed protein product [Ceratitis capitata]|uniref:(Mediterranean fruit fly) hypothetical protein n=1 Tax=Ceratitis capitata TaxID=7213 RepID=W8BTX1_CERCA|nr:unnamed protein product [Ceratitis capitata]